MKSRDDFKISVHDSEKGFLCEIWMKMAMLQKKPSPEDVQIMTRLKIALMAKDYGIFLRPDDGLPDALGQKTLAVTKEGMQNYLELLASAPGTTSRSEIIQGEIEHYALKHSAI